MVTPRRASWQNDSRLLDVVVGSGNYAVELDVPHLGFSGIVFFPALLLDLLSGMVVIGVMILGV